MTQIQKQPFKFIEIPLNKFKEEAIPHHMQIYEHHKAITQKLISTNKLDQLKKEVKDKKHILRQLKELIYELDTLRTQVENNDLDKFDEKTFSLRKIITSIIKDYAYIEKQALQLVQQTQNQLIEITNNDNPFQGAAQIQLQDDIHCLRLKEAEDTLKNVESLEGDVQDLQEIYVDLSHIIHEQAESVDKIENNVEDTKENVDQGLKQLIKASTLKTAVYPATGALIGTLVGGPVGFLAGFKLGGLAAISCGVAGYASGKFIKKCNDDQFNTSENEISSKSDEILNDSVEIVDKKKK